MGGLPLSEGRCILMRRSAKAIASIGLVATIGCSAGAQPVLTTPSPALTARASPPTGRPDPSLPAAAPASPSATTEAATATTAAEDTRVPRPDAGSSVEPPRPTGSLDAPAGNRRWIIEPVSLRLDMPSDWRGFLDEDLEAFPEMAGVAEAIGGIEDVSLVFAGADVAAGSNGVIGGTVNVMDVGEPVPDRALVPLAEIFAAGLETTEGISGQVHLGAETLAVGEAATASYTIAGDAASGGVATEVDMYLFVASERLVLMTFSTPPSPDDGLYGGISSIIRSISET